MFSLNLPAFDAKIVVRDGKRSIFDVLNISTYFQIEYGVTI